MLGQHKYKIIILGCAIAAVIAGLIWVSKSPGPVLPIKPSQRQQSSQAVSPSLLEDLSAIVKTYRKIIVLIEDEATLDAGYREAASMIGKFLFHENQQRLNALIDQLKKELENASAAGFIEHPANIEQFLSPLESPAEWHDADKLVFRDVVNQLAESIRGLPSGQSAGQPFRTELQERLESDQKALAEIQSLYNKELEKIFNRFETRGMVVRREAWDQYVAYLKTKFKREDILKEFPQFAPSVSKMPETKPPEKKPAKPHAGLELNGTELPPKTLVLTFDDGPHPKYTDRILEILKKYQTKAIFFQVGQNLGTLKKDNSLRPTQAAGASERAVKAGFLLANHSLTHAYLPKLEDKAMLEEIERPDQLLHTFADSPTNLFRPPYGAQNEKLLAQLESHGLKSVLWNIDSKDWADPIPKSIANRVVREISREKRGIILFHDIHERTIEALPLILETLKNDGYRFLTWNGKEFIDENPPSPQPTQATAAAPLYRESWAVIIGIDHYKNWPKLNYAVNDAKGLREILIRKYKFKPECVVTLLNEEATRERVLAALGDTMADFEKVKREDRVFVFFAGHGITRKLPSGRNLGYIVPVDADLQNYQGQCISMTNFQDISEAIPAKHLFFVMDSCYSGLALTRGAGAARAENYLREISRRTSRQMLTAGGANEQVEDNGPNGHSVFTWTLLQGLEGRADLNGDGFITGSELAAYVGPSVSALSKQTPAFGSLPGSEGGEFIFEPKQEGEFLSELSTQLDHEAIQLNDQLERIRKQIAEKGLRNEKLRKELAYARQAASKLEATAAKSQPGTAKAAMTKHVDRGNAFFKEKKYNEALKEFLAAYRMDVSNALVANNTGFVYYKLEQYEEAIQWYEKTIALDPRRAVAYVNLGDACLSLNRKAEARKAFEKYLELSPGSKNAEEVRNKLTSLE